MSHFSGSQSRDERIEPEFNGFQLIGDSQFVRFAGQLLWYERKRHDGYTHVGLCVSGQKIGDILRLANDKVYPITERCVLMIGTNDILQGTPISQMKEDIEALVVELIARGVQRLILLTIPPVPRLDTDHDHWERLHSYNTHIMSLHNDVDVFSVDVYPTFVRSNSTPCRFMEDRTKIADSIKYDFFEKYYSKKGGRTDLIHLNGEGLRAIRVHISEEIERIRRAMRV